MFNATFLMTHRIVCLCIGQVLFLFLLALPLFRLQIMKNDRYATMSESNRVVLRVVSAKRGEVFDRTGCVLAKNKESFHLVATPHSAKELRVILKKLSALINLTGVDEKDIFRRLSLSPSYLTSLLIKQNLSWEEVALLSLKSQELGRSVIVEPCFVRSYPMKELAAHLLGYTGPPTEKEENDLGLRRHLYMKVGRQGVERVFEKQLHGREGTDLLELDSRRRLVRSERMVAPQSGQDIHLALDIRLQKFCAEVVKEHRSASVVLMDVHTGEVLAFVSHPSFDPHVFSEKIQQDTWNALINNPHNPLLNKPIQGLYAPGSTIKSCLVLEGLERGDITPATTVNCTGVMHVGRHPFHCWMHRFGGHGNVNPDDAVMRSCDIFMYALARRLGFQKMVNVLSDFGVGIADLPGFSESKRGILPTPYWKKKTGRGAWGPGDTVQMSIGQGFMLATPLQLAVMTARLASGKRVTPTLLKCAQPPKFSVLSYSNKNLNFVRKTLFKVVNNRQGTAFRWRIDGSDADMAGKTGTSQVCRISLAERTAGVKHNKDRAWDKRDHALFVGYGPFALPKSGKRQFALSVTIDHGGGGGSVAAPIASKILRYAQALDS